MARRTEYVSFLGAPRSRNRDFAGLETHVGLRLFVLPGLVVGFVAISVWWFAFRSDNSDVGGVLTLEDATIPTVLLPSGAAAGDAGLLLSGVSIDCEEELTSWTSLQGSITHQGCIQAPTITNPSIEWRIFTGIAGWLNSPLIVGDRIFVASAGRAQGTEDARDGVYAYDLYSGRQEWFFGATLDMNGLGYGNGIIVATGDEGRVWGIDASDGTLIWEEALGVATFGYPLVLAEDNLVVVGDADGVVTAYNLRNGGQLWQRQVDGPVRGGAVSDGEMIVVAGENRDVLALDKSGDELWRVKVVERDTAGALARIWAPPTIVRDRVVDGEPEPIDMVIITMLREDTFAEPAITALKLSDGSQVWQATDAAGIKNEWGSIRSSVAVVGDLLVYGEPYSDRLVALDIETGETAWDVQTGAYCFPHWPSPAVVSGQVIMARHDGALYGVDIETQTKVWEIYLGNDAGTFPADFETAGFCEWAPQTGYSVLASPAVAANGMIVVGTLEGYLVLVGDRSW